MKKSKKTGAAVLEIEPVKISPTYSEDIEEKKKGKAGGVIHYAVELVGWIWAQMARFVVAYPVKDITPNPNNPRGANPRTDDIRGPITRPLLLTHDGRIVQGHRRHAAAMRQGLPSVMALILPEDTPEEALLELAADHGGEKGLQRVEIARQVSYLTTQGHSEKRIFTLLREALNELNPMQERNATTEYKRHRNFIQQVGRLDELRANGAEAVASEYEKNWQGDGKSKVKASDLNAATKASAEPKERAEVIAELTERLAQVDTPETEAEAKARKLAERLARVVGAAWLEIFQSRSKSAARTTVREYTATIQAEDKENQQKKAKEILVEMAAK